MTVRLAVTRGFRWSCLECSCFSLLGKKLLQLQARGYLLQEGAGGGENAIRLAAQGTGDGPNGEVCLSGPGNHFPVGPILQHAKQVRGLLCGIDRACPSDPFAANRSLRPVVVGGGGGRAAQARNLRDAELCRVDSVILIASDRKCCIQIKNQNLEQDCHFGRTAGRSGGFNSRIGLSRQGVPVAELVTGQL